MSRGWYEKPGQQHGGLTSSYYSAAIFRAMVSTMLPLNSV